MAISPQLLNFKSSGVYRLEFDKSQTSSINVETLRLVVGHSRKGPYNTPVLIDSRETLENVFGGIDRTLEKNGMFFHRSCLDALSRGPILALNLGKFTAEEDITNFQSLSTNGSIPNMENVEGSDDYTKFFDNDKFMVPSDTETLKTIANDQNHILNFVNIKQDSITIIVRQAANVNEFDLTAREWYGEGLVPEYLNDFDRVSDFMVDVFVFRGEFDAVKMSNDPIYSKYFTVDGIDKTKLNEFTNLRQVSLIAQYTGSILPGFKNIEGRNLYIESIINAEARRTGLFCAVDEDMVMNDNGTAVDFVGHVCEAGNVYSSLSHNIKIDDRIRTFEFGTDDAGVYTHTTGNTNFVVKYLSADAPSVFEISNGELVQSSTVGRLARVSRVSKAVDNTHVTYTVLTDVEPLYDNKIIKTFENASATYSTFVLSKAGITVKNLSDYLNVLSKGVGLYDALVDKDTIDFRYVVDTFKSFDINGLNNKSNLSQLAKDRQNASAILNAPTVEDFKKSSNPSFSDENGVFQTRFIPTGGNLDKNPTKIYTLPGILEGANYAFYYGPGLIVSDNGKDIVIPAAAAVSNNFIDKYTSSLPWSIVAGPRRGVVSGNNVKGVEYAFDKSDRDIIEPFGINPIVFQRGTGLTILGNKTAQQTIKSALSSAHVREVLIYIQDGMANILKDYVFEFNNVQTRLEIKTLADSFMESVKQDGGVYEFSNIMDQTNNTNEVIDNNIGIIDTFVEPVKGLEIVVHRTTILNTGEIQSGNL
jgi:hypothetical protein